jgi:hypothetical protein
MLRDRQAGERPRRALFTSSQSMDTEQRALFDALDLIHYQDPAMHVTGRLTCNSLMCREFPGCGKITWKLGLGGASRSCADYLLQSPAALLVTRGSSLQ